LIMGLDFNYSLTTRIIAARTRSEPSIPCPSCTAGLGALTHSSLVEKI